MLAKSRVAEGAAAGCCLKMLLSKQRVHCQAGRSILLRKGAPVGVMCAL